MPKRIDEDDDTDNTDGAAQAAIERTKKAKEGAAEPKDPGDRSVEVKLDNDEDDGPADEPPEHKRTRQENKKLRGEFVERTKAAEDRAARLEAEVARLGGYVQASIQGQKREPEVDPTEKEIADIDKQRQRIHDYHTSKNASGTLSREEHEELDREYNDLGNRRVSIVANRGKSQTQAEDPRMVATEMILQSKYPEVFAHPQGRQLVSAEYYKLIAKAGNTNEAKSDFRITETAFENILDELGLRKRKVSAPTRAERAEYTGMSDGPRVNQTSARSVRMTEAQQKIAEAQYPKMKPEQAHVKWARKHSADVEKMGA